MKYTVYHYWYWALLFVVAAVGLSSCGSNDTFAIDATVDGLGTQNVRAIYRTEGHQEVVFAQALDGKFRIIGHSKLPVVVDFFNGTRSYIGSVVAKNGDEVKVRFDVDDRTVMQVSGNSISEQLAKFRRDNLDAFRSENSVEINDAVAKFIVSNPDKAVSPYLLLTYFNSRLDCDRADSLLSIIDDKVALPVDIASSYRELLALNRDTVNQFHPFTIYRINGDSLVKVSPDNGKGLLLAFTDIVDGSRIDSTVVRLNESAKSLSTASVVEISFAVDTATLRARSVVDKPEYARCWSPAAVAMPEIARLQVKNTPIYLSVDSTMAIVYRGDDLDAAIAILK